MADNVDSPPRRWLDPRSPSTRRRAGRTMMTVAYVGLVVALFGAIVGWRLLANLSSSSRESLDVTIEALESVEDSIDLADEILGSTRQTVDAVESSLTSLAESLAIGNDVVGNTAELSEPIGTALTDVEVTLRQLEDLGTTIDGLLGDLSNLPFGPSYSPESGLGDTLGRLADDIEPLPDLMDQTSTGLRALTTTLNQLETELDQLAGRVAEVGAGLNESSSLIDRYRENVLEAQSVAEEARDDIDSDVGFMRILVVLAALTFAGGQIVPFWVGRELLQETPA